MKARQLIAVLVLVAAAPQISAAQIADTCAGEGPNPSQKTLVSHLSGRSPVGDTIRLVNRYTDSLRSAAASYLQATLRRVGDGAERHVYRRYGSWGRWLWGKPYEGTNVYATIPATIETDEYVVIGAHYDSVVSEMPSDPTEAEMPGANDNASGVALVYRVARELRRVRPRTKNIMVVFFDQEEQGRIGSRAFAEKLREEGGNVHSAHTVDQIGWDSDGDRAVELERPSSKLESLYRKTAEEMNIPVHVTGVSSTDHQSFRERGIQAVGITEEYQHGDTTPHIHRSSDTHETIDFEYLASSTCLVENVLTRLIQ